MPELEDSPGNGTLELLARPRPGSNLSARPARCELSQSPAPSAQSGTPPAAGWRVSEGRPGPPPTVVVVMMTDDDKSHAATADAASS